MTHLITVLLALHGALHLLGVAYWWRLATVAQMRGATLLPTGPGGARTLGLLWLAAALLLVTAAGLRVAARDWWWTVGVSGVLISQTLIAWQWGDAWAGTVPNLVLAVVVAVAGSSARFHAESRAMARQLLASSPAVEASAVRAEDLDGLPAPVRRWLTWAGVVGEPRAHTVRLRQAGGLRTAPDQPYMPVTAEQYFTVDEPGFVWMVDVTMARVVPVVGRDAYVGGTGRMLIRAGGLVTVADGTGPAFDQGTALRYLGEIIWFPSAALSPRIAWTAVDAGHADATLTWRGQTVTARFGFGSDERPETLEALRFYNGERLEPWMIPMTAWGRVHGIQMPVRGGAVWKLATGDFDYFQWEIRDVEANARALWP